MRQGQRRSGVRNSARTGVTKRATLQIHVPGRPNRSIVEVRDSVQDVAATWTRALCFLCSEVLVIIVVLVGADLCIKPTAVLFLGLTLEDQ